MFPYAVTLASTHLPDEELDSISGERIVLGQWLNQRPLYLLTVLLQGVLH